MIDDIADSAAPSTPNAALCDWANEQAHWVRKIVSLVLSSAKLLTSEEVELVHTLALIENGLLHGPLQPVPSLGSEPVSEEAQESLLLIALDKVSNVNALAEGQRIDFDASLTVIFGENASGKTGYTRILKRLAATRTAEMQILPNAHEATEEAGIPSAVIEYALGDERYTVEWENELGLEPFDRMSVFDSPAVALHIDEDLGYVFTPAGLGLFSDVAQSIQECQKRFSAEIAELGESNRFASSFEEGTEVGGIIGSLGAETDLQVLGTLAKLSVRDVEKLESLEIEHAALKAGNVRLLLVEARQMLRSVELLGDVYEPASQFDEIAYEAARSQLEGAIKASEAARQAVFEEDSPFGLPDDTWQAFINSADRYLKHTGRSEYPADISVCPYCHQPLGQDAVELLDQYRRFLDDALQKAVADCEKAIDTAAPKLDTVTATKAKASIEGLDVANVDNEWLDAGTRFLTKADDAVEASSHRLQIGTGLREAASTELAKLSLVIDRLKRRIEELEPEAEGQAEALGSREHEMRELQARRALGSLYLPIAQHVNRAMRRVRLQTLVSTISGVLRILTLTSKTVSEAIQNRSFDKLFEEECARLGAPTVNVEYQGRLGEAHRHKDVGNRQPSEILSDGEQRMLALADFLAECRMREVSSPIIFDDPVSSLDYRRSGRVAERLVKLSKDYQIIVFTHNVLFVTELLHLRNSKAERIAFYEVRNDGHRIGVVSSNVEPRLDHPNKIAPRIDKLIAAAVETEGAEQDLKVSQAIDLVRKWLEAFVEKILFAEVIQRYRSDIRLGSIENIRVDRLADAITQVASAYEVSSRNTEAHSQGIEQMNVRLTVRDLEDLWEGLTEMKTTFEA